MRLDRWIVFGNCLVGYAYDGPFPRGTRIMTEPIRFIDPCNMSAECIDGNYKLLDPGTPDEHNTELIGVKPYVDTPDIDKSIFLNPRG